MDTQKRCLRFGAAVIVCAILIRLMSVGAFAPLDALLNRSDVLSFLMYLETGRRASLREPDATAPREQPSQAPSVPPETEPETPTFTEADLERISIRYDGAYRPDLSSLLLSPLRWDLTENGPAVLILHTHTTESYTPEPGEDYVSASDYRTLDESYNMLSIGDKVAEILEAGGISVLHDRELHDYPSYNGSYPDARETALSYLNQYPSIRLVLDLHRDAAEDSTGQVATHAQIDGADSAQLMLVVGTDEGGLEHPDWENNLSLALQLDAQLESLYPGLCRPISLRTERFNQDLSGHALLVEVGTAGNTHTQALRAAEALAQGILALSRGANTQ